MQSSKRAYPADVEVIRSLPRDPNCGSENFRGSLTCHFPKPAAQFTPSPDRPSKLRIFRTNPTDRLMYVFLLMAFILMNCKHSTEPEPDPVDNIVSLGIHPLKVGYYWHYKTVALNEDSTEGNEIEQVRFEITRRSHSPQKPDEPLFHKVFVNPYTNGRSEFEWLYRNYEDGLYLMGGEMSTDTVYTTIRLLKYPAAKGESWVSPHLVYNLIDREYQITDSTVYTCVDTSAVFETPVGTFSCVVYYHREPLDEDVSAEWDIYEYYSDDVGLVGIVTVSYFEFDQQTIPKSRRVLVSTNALGNH